MSDVSIWSDGGSSIESEKLRELKPAKCVCVCVNVKDIYLPKSCFTVRSVSRDADDAVTV